MARRARPNILAGKIHQLPERSWTSFRSGLRVVRALPVRALHHHMENSLQRAAIDEAHPRCVERRWRSQERPADGYGKPLVGESYWTDEHDLCCALARRQCWVVSLGRGGSFPSFAHSASAPPTQLPRMGNLVKFSV